MQTNVVKSLIADNDVSGTYKEKLKELYIDDKSKNEQGITISIGVANSDKHTKINDLIKVADKYLFHSKKTGRNRTTYVKNYTENGPNKT